MKDESSDALYWQGVMVDITERKRAEAAMAASERQFRSIFDAAAIGVMTIGLDGRIVEANPTLEQICEYPPGALNGRLLRDYLEPSDRTSLERFDELVTGQTDRCNLEHLFRRNDRSLMWCRTVMALVRDDDGRPAHVTAMLEDISDRKLVEADLVHRTLHDPLTELPNRQYFLDRLRQTRARRFSTGAGVGVVFMDLDGFKEVNDTQGHQAGDDLLLAVARRLRDAIRPSDTVARFGGDEFVVLAGEVESPTDATQLAWRLTNTLRAPFTIGGSSVNVTASIGVAYSDDPQDAAEDIIRKADATMYLAKRRGRSRVEVHGQRRRPERRVLALKSSRKARTASWYSGTGSRNESCPCGDAISRCDTAAPADSSMSAISTEWRVGKRQSVSNDSTSVRVARAAAAPAPRRRPRTGRSSP